MVGIWLYCIFLLIFLPDLILSTGLPPTSPFSTSPLPTTSFPVNSFPSTSFPTTSVPTSTQAPEDYTHSQAFKTWLNDILVNYDNRVRPFFGVRKLTIRLGLSLIGISSVSETDMSFTVEMFFYETWTDNRLKFDPDSFGTRYPITLPLHSPKVLWTPDTSFLNALKSRTPEEGSVSHLYSMVLYPNGTIGYSRRISVTAQCLMDLTMYPFDKQACTLALSSYGWTDEDIVYDWLRDSVSIKGISLADFDAEYSRVRITRRGYAAGNFSVPTLCVVLARRSGFCFLQLFVPATAVVMSSWIALWHENETQFTDLVSVILAIIFLSYSYNTVMPKVSYVKAMDIYLLACFIFVFFSLVKLAIVKYMRQVVHKRKEKRAASMAASNPPPVVVEEPVIMPVEGSEGTKECSEADHLPVPYEEVEDELEHIVEPTPLLVKSEEIKAVPCRVEPISFLDIPSSDTKQEDDDTPRSRHWGLHRPSWRRFPHRRHSDRGQCQQGEKKRRRMINRAAVQHAITRRVLHFRWPVGAHMINMPSLHDNYWRCMKAFHLGSQLFLPLAFAAFAVFFFFVYPYLPLAKEGRCE